MGMRGYTGEYTWVYKGFTRVCIGIHGYIGVYKGVHGYAGIYKGIEGYTWV